MFDEVVACLDGSPTAERILPVARTISTAMQGHMTVLRVVADIDELAAEEGSLRELARRYGAEVRFVFSDDVPGAIIAEIEKHPSSIPAMTSHGRSSLFQALMGSVALSVVRSCGRPVLVYRPLRNDPGAPAAIKTIAIALDGGRSAEQAIPHSMELAKALRSRLLLLQAVPVQPPVPAGADQETIIMLESSYLRRKAAVLREENGIEVDWEVLHGDAAAAIPEFLRGRRDAILSMTTHTSGLKRAFFGSVAASCVQNSGLPMLIYWPPM